MLAPGAAASTLGPTAKALIPGQSVLPIQASLGHARHATQVPPGASQPPCHWGLPGEAPAAGGVCCQLDFIHHSYVDDPRGGDHLNRAGRVCCARHLLALLRQHEPLREAVQADCRGGATWTLGMVWWAAESAWQAAIAQPCLLPEQHLHTTALRLPQPTPDPAPPDPTPHTPTWPVTRWQGTPAALRPSDTSDARSRNGPAYIPVRACFRASRAECVLPALVGPRCATTRRRSARAVGYQLAGLEQSAKGRVRIQEEWPVCRGGWGGGVPGGGCRTGWGDATH